MHKYLVRHLANKSKLPDKLAGSGADRQQQRPHLSAYLAHNNFASSGKLCARLFIGWLHHFRHSCCRCAFYL